MPIRGIIKWSGWNAHPCCTVVLLAFALNQPNYCLCSTGWLINCLINQFYPTISIICIHLEIWCNEHQPGLYPWNLDNFINEICIALFNQDKYGKIKQVDGRDYEMGKKITNWWRVNNQKQCSPNSLVILQGRHSLWCVCLYCYF